MEEIQTKHDNKQVTADSPPTSVDGYVSPDVAAAQAGETVDFSKAVNDDEEDAEPDTDA